MENEKSSFLKKLNPGNLKFTYKILLIAFGIVFLTQVAYFTVGLRTMYRTSINIMGDHLEEIGISKAAELELRIEKQSRKIKDIVSEEQVMYAASTTITAFSELANDKPELFYGDSKLAVREKLSNYYQQHIASYSPVSADEIVALVPEDENTLAAQSIYIVQNPKEYPDKENYFNPDDYSAFASAHNNNHGLLLDKMRQLGASDVYVIDPKTGYVVYSAQKHIDFGANLFTGKMKHSALAEAFQKALADDNSEVQYSYSTYYPPAMDKPVSFAAYPQKEYNQVNAVLVFQFTTDLFDDILFDNSMVRGFTSLEFDLIDQELVMLNNPKDFLIDSEKFVKQYARKIKRNKVDQFFNAASTGSLAGYFQFSAKSRKELLSGEAVELEDYKGQVNICFAQPVTINNTNLFLVTKINKSEVLLPFKQMGLFYLAITLILLTIVFLISRTVGNQFGRRLGELMNALNLLRAGEKSAQIDIEHTDELGNTIQSYNQLRKRIINAEEFALEMSEGNYDFHFDVLSDRDSLGKSLNVLKEKLRKSKVEQDERAKEDEVRNWMNTGIARFNDLLRQNNDNINVLAYSLIENLIEYLDANIGGIFMVEGEHEENKVIELIASYAYDRRKYHKKTQEIQEGLLGACYLEKKPIYLKQIPEDYIEIVSGLGHQQPNVLYIVPLMIDTEVMGMIEIASIKELDTHHKEFLEKVADNIAATFVSVRLNMKTANLLEESRSRAEEIAQQEEEMRQNMEEMQATQEELARLRQEDEKRTREMQLVIDNTRSTLKNMLDEIPGGYNLKDQNGVIHLINAEGAEYYGISAEKALGKTDHELLAAKLYEVEHKNDLLVIDAGEQQYTESAEIKGKKYEFKVIKRPFMMEEIGQQGILTMRFKQ